jgi:type I restriction enzyme S subunit
MSAWEIKKLGEVIKLEYGKPLPKESRDESGKYPAYGANGVKCWSNQYYLDRQSIIVGRKGSAGEVNLTDEKFWPLDVTYFVTYDDTQYDLIFLYHCLKHFRLTKLAKGVKPGINRNDVYQIEFTFPPLPEQKRIVAILDEAFEGIDRAIANTEKNLANARELFESYLNTIFTQKGNGWEEKKLKEISECVSVGYVGETSSFYCDEDDGVPFVRSQNVRPGRLELDGVRYVTKEFHTQVKKSRLLPGDLLFVRVGANRGDCCSVPNDIEELNCANIVFARPRKGLIEYLEYYCQSKIGRELLMGMTTGSAQGVINTKSVAELPIPFPPIDEQRHISDRIKALAVETQRLETIYRQKIAALNELKQSILQKAFTGELTADRTNQTTKAAQEVNAA